MAVTVKCGSEELRLTNGTILSVSEVLDLAEERFGKLDSKKRHATGGFLLESDELIAAGEYEYAAEAPERDPSFGDLYTPSSRTFNSVRTAQRAPKPDIYNFRPPETAAPSLPLQLMHPVFGTFVDMVGGRIAVDCKAEDYDFYYRLAMASCAFYERENDMMDAVRELWREYTGIYVQEEMATGKFSKNPSAPTTRTDLGIRDDVSDAVLALLEGRLGFSTCEAEPDHQAVDNLKLYYCRARPKVKERLSDTCYPAFIMDQIGPVFRVGAAALLSGCYMYQPLAVTALVPVQEHDAAMAEKGVILCVAVKSCLLMLRSFYRSWHAQGPDPDPVARQLWKAEVPYPLHELLSANAKVTRVSKQRMYLVNEVSEGGSSETRVVKYVQRYGSRVHKAWADAGFAPKLLSLHTIQGGWMQVTMEHLRAEDGWKPLLEHPQAEKLRLSVIKALVKAHKVRIGGGEACGVHGDMRDANVMVKAGNDKVEVRFIDFDWAAEQGVGVYPGFMNPDINWAESAGPGLPMLQEHDVVLLLLPQHKQIKIKAVEVGRPVKRLKMEGECMPRAWDLSLL